MPEIKLISPLLDGMEIVQCVCSGGGTSVYRLYSRRVDRYYMLKHISIPESQTQVDALIFTGAASDEAAAQKYYEQVVSDYLEELRDLDTLRGSANFAAYADYQAVPKEEGVGFEVYLLAEQWLTLVEYLSENAMTHLRALNLGLDLCTALCDLRAHGLIHRDIKPENIYLNGTGGFMLGDLGVARIDALKYCAMPERMVTEYTAPELTDILCEFNTTVDIYSIGMVLYRLFNGNHGPFEDEQTSSKAANKRRVSGEDLLSPLYSDYELTEIILKACAFDPAARYQSPEDLMQELVLYMKRNSVTDSLIVPPIITDPDTALPADIREEAVEPVRFADVEAMDEAFVESFAPDAAEPDAAALEDDADEDGPPGSGPPQPAFAAPRTSLRREEDDEPPPDESGGKKKKKRGRTWIPVTIAAVLLCVIGVCVYFLFFSGGPVEVTSLDVSDRGADYLTVTIALSDNTAPVELQCADTYGNTQSQPYVGLPITFDSLEPGAQYTLTVSPRGSRTLTGSTTLRTATVANTEIVSFTARAPLTGQAELTLVVSGPSPEEWTVRYAAEGVEAQEVSFAGSTVSIFNLETNLDYTFELLPPDGITLSGQTTLTFSTGPEIEIRDLEAVEITKDSVRVVWTCGEAQPESWSVTCTGTDGSTRTQSVTACEASFNELSTGETYTISVTSADTATPATIAVTPTAANVTALTAALQEDGSMLVSWTSDLADGRWQLIVTVEGSELTERLNVQGNQTTVTGLIPGVVYQLELRSGAGERLTGEVTASLSVPAAESFGDYDTSRFFLGLFQKPSKAAWGKNDLGKNLTEFAPGDGIAFAVQPMSEPERSEDTIDILYVVYTDRGVPVQTGSSSAAWDEMFPEADDLNDMLYLSSLSDPIQEPGDYVLRLYFNGKLAVAKDFTITE